jgi:hypothetical protein
VRSLHLLLQLHLLSQPQLLHLLLYSLNQPHLLHHLVLLLHLLHPSHQLLQHHQPLQLVLISMRSFAVRCWTLFRLGIWSG